MKLKVLILDLAGTLIDPFSKAPLLAIKNAFRKEFGESLKVSDTLIMKSMGKSKKDHIREILSTIETKDKSVDRIEHLLRETNSNLTRLIDTPEYHTLFPGVLKTLHQARFEHKLILTATTGYGSNIADRCTYYIKKQGFTFDKLVASDEVLKGRPYPDMIHKIQEFSNCCPAQILKVGDTLEDIKEGKNANTWTCGVYGHSLLSLKKQGGVDFGQAIRAFHNYGSHFTAHSVSNILNIVSSIEQF